MLIARWRMPISVEVSCSPILENFRDQWQQIVPCYDEFTIEIIEYGFNFCGMFVPEYAAIVHKKNDSVTNEQRFKTWKDAKATAKRIWPGEWPLSKGN